MSLEEKICSEELLYDGKIIKVKKFTVELPDGTKAFREEVQHNGGACVLPYFNGKVYLVKQYRLATMCELLELPAGKVELGEDPELSAKRELREETGFIADNLVKISSISPSPGYTNERIHIYFADNLKVSEQQLDEGEMLNVVSFSPSECFKMIESGEIYDAKTVVALLYLKNLLNKN